MDYSEQLDVTWQLNVDFPQGLGVGGALCFTEDGYLLTAYHVIVERGGESPQKVIATCDSRKMKDRKQFNAVYVYGFPSADLAILKLDSNAKFMFKEITQEIQVNIGDEVVTHGHASIPFSSLFAKVAYPYKFRGNLESLLSELENPDYIVKKMDHQLLKTMRLNYPTPTYRTTGGCLAMDEFGICFDYRSAGFLELHPSLPLIQLSTSGGQGFSGCPTFGRKDNKLIGLLIVGDGLYSYLVPVNVISHVLKLIEKKGGFKALIKEKEGFFKHIGVSKFSGGMSSTSN